MPRLTKLYTGKGDEGNTRLSSGETVSKSSARVAAYGTVDELNAEIGLAMTMNIDALLTGKLAQIQNDLFHLGSDLSFIGRNDDDRLIPQIEARHVAKIENLIDDFNEEVGTLENFILPGGTQGAAQLHVARTVCRRAEREVTTLAEEEQIGSFVLPYLNRLSDLLFVMARFENQKKGVDEPLWDTKA